MILRGCPPSNIILSKGEFISPGAGQRSPPLAVFEAMNQPGKQLPLKGLLCQGGFITQFLFNAIQMMRLHARQFGNPPDRLRFASSRINIHQDTVETHLTFGDREIYRHTADKTLDDRLDFTAEHRFGRTAHARIADKCRSPREYLLVGCLHVRMSTSYGRNPAIQEPSQSDLFARGFRMDIHKYHMCLRAYAPNLFLNYPKRILKARLHEGSSLDVDNPDFTFCSFKHD